MLVVTTVCLQLEDGSFPRAVFFALSYIWRSQKASPNLQVLNCPQSYCWNSLCMAWQKTMICCILSRRDSTWMKQVPMSVYCKSKNMMLLSKCTLLFSWFWSYILNHPLKKPETWSAATDCLLLDHRSS